MSDEIVNALLEGDEIPDPKYFSNRVPTVYDDAVRWAVAKFDEWADVEFGAGRNPKSADEKASEIAQDACVEFGLDDNDDYDAVVTPLYKHAAEKFPGTW